MNFIFSILFSDKKWSGFLESLSALFCASLPTVAKINSVKPSLDFCTASSAFTDTGKSKDTKSIFLCFLNLQIFIFFEY